MRAGVRRQSLINGVLLTAMAVAAALAVFVLTGPATRDDPLPTEPAVAVIALAHNITADSSLDAIAADRLETAMQLVRRGHAPRLITTRVQPGVNGPTSDSGQARLVRLAGLEQQWVIAPGVMNNTREEALAVRSMLPESTRVIVVTSPSHTRRACAAFERVGFVVTCVASSNRAVTRRRLMKERVYERLATWKYRYDGWIR